MAKITRAKNVVWGHGDVFVVTQQWLDWLKQTRGFEGFNHEKAYDIRVGDLLDSHHVPTDYGHEFVLVDYWYTDTNGAVCGGLLGIPSAMAKTMRLKGA